MTSLLSHNDYEARLKRKVKSFKWQAVHLDPWLFFSLLALVATGIFILYSASNENFHLVEKQLIWLCVAFAVMFVFAQIPPRRYYQWAPWIYTITLLLLFAVLLLGSVHQGARRWIGFSFLHIQPSELMKIAMPMMMSWFLSDKPLPPSIRLLSIAAIIMLVPVLLVAKQPDLGTAIIIACTAIAVLLFAGISWRLLLSLFGLGLLASPLIWHFMHAYQRLRVLTFFNPERDPLGSGYHIIQSKIAIGSGGVLGKGWLEGTQSHLSFLPAHATDFIFAVSGEELGLIGCCVIIGLFLLLFGRALYISSKAQNTFTRLLAGSLALTFLLSAFVNIGMVIGVLPVVGVPLPLISYGGSSLVTTLAAFGIIMSIHTHRKLWSS